MLNSGKKKWIHLIRLFSYLLIQSFILLNTSLTLEQSLPIEQNLAHSLAVRSQIGSEDLQKTFSLFCTQQQKNIQIFQNRGKEEANPGNSAQLFLNTWEVIFNILSSKYTVAGIAGVFVFLHGPVGIFTLGIAAILAGIITVISLIINVGAIKQPKRKVIIAIITVVLLSIGSGMLMKLPIKYIITEMSSDVAEGKQAGKVIAKGVSGTRIGGIISRFCCWAEGKFNLLEVEYLEMTFPKYQAGRKFYAQLMGKDKRISAGISLKKYKIPGNGIVRIPIKDFSVRKTDLKSIELILVSSGNIAYGHKLEQGKNDFAVFQKIRVIYSDNHNSGQTGSSLRQDDQLLEKLMDVLTLPELPGSEAGERNFGNELEKVSYFVFLPQDNGELKEVELSAPVNGKFIELQPLLRQNAIEMSI